MLMRRFGKLNQSISAIGFGGGAISGEGGGYGFGLISEEESINLLRTAFDQGINLFDTAPIYGYGLSEQRIGKAFKQMRDDIFLVSKGGVAWDEQKRIRLDNRPETIQTMLEQSLKDLQTDFIDLYMIHWPDPNVDIRRPMAVLSEAKESGKIKAIGLCNTSVKDLQKTSETAPVDVVQGEFNLFKRDVATSLFPTIAEQSLGFMAWGPLDKGILTGRVTPQRTFDKVDFRASKHWRKHEDPTPKFHAMEKINALLKKHHFTGLELALGFVMRDHETSTALCGVRSPDQLTSAINALDHLPPNGLIDQAIDLASAAIE